MGFAKTTERKVKRALIRLATSVIRTPARTKEEILARTPERILVIRQHNQMGDMLLAVPALRAIKQTFPGVFLAVLTARINRAVLLDHPFVDQVLTYDNRNPLSHVSLIRNMRAGRFDMVIVLHTVSFSFTSALLGRVSGARIRVGSTSRPFGNSLSAAFYHYELPLPDAEELSRMNEAEHNLYPLAALGIRTDDLSPVVVPTPQSERWASEFLARHKTGESRVIVVHPGAGKTENIWPPDKFAEVINRLSERTPIALFALEGPRDAAPVRRFCRLARPAAVVIRDRPIGDVAAALRQADLVLCNDTGIMHVSGAAGARTLAVFGPTDPMRWAPRCPNLYVIRGERGDLEGLTAAAVYERAMDVLGIAAAG